MTKTLEKSAELHSAAKQELQIVRSTKERISLVISDLAKIGIAKERENKFDNYNFRGIDDVYNALASIISEHGVLIYPNVIAIDTQERQSAKGAVLFYKTVTVEYTVTSAADDGFKCVVMGEAMDRGDKAINKAMSAAYKLLAFQLFCIPVDGQDSEAETHTVVQPAQKPKTSTAPKPNQSPFANGDERKQWLIDAVTVMSSFKDRDSLETWRKVSATHINALGEKQKEAFEGKYQEALEAVQEA